MFIHKYFKPSEVRAGARELFERATKEERSKIADSLGVTVANLWTACRSKEGEEQETMRGIPGCVAILQQFGVKIEAVPFYKVTEVKLKGPAPLDIQPPTTTG